MKNKLRYLITFICLSFLMFMASNAWAVLEYMDGKLMISGFFRTQVGIHIGQRNPNLDFTGEDNHHLSMFRNSIQLEPEYKFTDLCSLYARLRFANEDAEWDDDLKEFQAFPKSYPGDLKLEEDQNMFELEEVYLDWEDEAERFWLRLGKQQVSWGQTDGLRLLDIVNPLDQTWHGVNLLEPYLEAFDNLRESLWMVRATGVLPSFAEDLYDLQLELLWIPQRFVPVQLPDARSPYNLLPFANIGLPVDEEHPHGQEWGFRLMGVYKHVEFSLNYFSHYVDEGLTNIGTLFTKGYINIEHPRKDSYGFSLTYDDNLHTKAVYRLEFLYEPNASYESAGPFGPMSGPIVDRGTIKYVLGIDRPTFIKPLNRNRTFSFGFQLIQFIVVENGDDLKQDGITLNGSPVKEMTTMFSLSCDTAYMQDRIKPNFLFIYDEHQAYYVQTGCEFRFSDHLIANTAISLFGGEDKSCSIGSLYWMDEFMFRLTYQF